MKKLVDRIILGIILLMVLIIVFKLVNGDI